jgi:hypothetical protein
LDGADEPRAGGTQHDQRTKRIKRSQHGHVNLVPGNRTPGAG